MSRPRKDKIQETNSPFKKLRLKAKLSQEQLAREIGVEGRSGFPTMPNRLVGVAVSTIRRWEKGQAEPTMTVAQMKNFCQAIKQNFEELPNSLMPEQPLANDVEKGVFYAYSLEVTKK